MKGPRNTILVSFGLLRFQLEPQQVGHLICEHGTKENLRYWAAKALVETNLSEVSREYGRQQRNTGLYMRRCCSGIRAGWTALRCILPIGRASTEEPHGNRHSFLQADGIGSRIERVA